MKKNGKAASKLSSWIDVPRQALTRARDFYVNSMMDCASSRSQSAVILGMPAGQSHSFHRSRSRRGGSSSSSSSSRGEHDVNELIRAAAAKSKSKSMEIMRIDEDKPCYFGGNIGVGYPKTRRSRSYEAPANRRNVILLA